MPPGSRPGRRRVPRGGAVSRPVGSVRLLRECREAFPRLPSRSDGHNGTDSVRDVEALRLSGCELECGRRFELVLLVSVGHRRQTESAKLDLEMTWREVGSAAGQTAMTADRPTSL
jgi:hypothetical protein